MPLSSFFFLFVVSGSRGLLGGSIFCLSWALAAVVSYYLAHGPNSLVSRFLGNNSTPEDMSGVS